jgi:hypothetical protein
MRGSLVEPNVAHSRSESTTYFLKGYSLHSGQPPVYIYILDPIITISSRSFEPNINQKEVPKSDTKTIAVPINLTLFLLAAP